RGLAVLVRSYRSNICTEGMTARQTTTRTILPTITTKHTTCQTALARGIFCDRVRARKNPLSAVKKP
ncbi:hypothetical protein, partial [Pseudomonas caspiana]|uniref:hypothetical protein n=1 Tax=Pseudomonas caspiana TaxID=1451454 RepID=UPI001EE6B006